MFEEKEGKVDKELESQPKSEYKEKSQTKKEAHCIHRVTQCLKEAEDAIDELLVEGTTPSIAVLGILVTSFYESMQKKMMVVLKRDPVFKTISDRIDAERASKERKETDD